MARLRRHHLAFGSPVRGPEYTEGDVPFSPGRGFGWIGDPERKAMVGHREGAWFPFSAGACDETIDLPRVERVEGVAPAEAQRRREVGRERIERVSAPVVLDPPVPDWVKKMRIRKLPKLINHALGHRPPQWATDEGCRFLEAVLK